MFYFVVTVLKHVRWRDEAAASGVPRRRRPPEREVQRSDQAKGNAALQQRPVPAVELWRLGTCLSLKHFTFYTCMLLYL